MNECKKKKMNEWKDECKNEWIEYLTDWVVNAYKITERDVVKLSFIFKWDIYP